MDKVFTESASGTHVVTGAEVTATTLDVATPFTATGIVVTVLRAGIDVTNAIDVVIGTLKVTFATNGTDFVLTEDDVINYIVF